MKTLTMIEELLNEILDVKVVTNEKPAASRINNILLLLVVALADWPSSWFEYFLICQPEDDVKEHKDESNEDDAVMSEDEEHED